LRGVCGLFPNINKKGIIFFALEDGDFPLPELSWLGLCARGLTFAHNKGGSFNDFTMSYPSSGDRFTQSSFAAELLLS
jgi:hypothetical protein